MSRVASIISPITGKRVRLRMPSGRRLRVGATIRHVFFQLGGQGIEFHAEIYSYDGTQFRFMSAASYSRPSSGSTRSNFCGLHFIDGLNAVMFLGGDYLVGGVGAARDMWILHGNWCQILPVPNLRPAGDTGIDDTFCPSDCLDLIIAGDCASESAAIATVYPRKIVYPNLGMTPHKYGSAAYDSARDVLVVFSGMCQVYGKTVSDTCDWGDIVSPLTCEFHFKTRKWKVVTCSGPVYEISDADETRMLGRLAAAPSGGDMVYDSDRGVCVLFGGRFVTGEPPSDHINGHFGDTHEYDHTEPVHSDKWTKTVGIDDGPGARGGFALCYVPKWYDEDTEQWYGGFTLLHGGQMASGSHVKNDFWRYGRAMDPDTGEFSGSPAWTEITGVGGDTLPGRRTHAMAFDEHRKKVVIVAGTRFDADEVTPLDDGTTSAVMHEYDVKANTVAQVASITPVNPGGRSLHAMCYDRCRKAVALFGGAQQFGHGQPGDSAVWYYDGVAWTHDGDVAAAAGEFARSGHCQLYIGSGVWVIFGGATNTTFVYYFGRAARRRTYPANALLPGTYPNIDMRSGQAIMFGTTPMVLGRNASNPTFPQFWRYDAAAFNPTDPPDGFDPFNVNPWIEMIDEWPLGMVGGVDNVMWTEFAFCYSSLTNQAIAQGGFRRHAVSPEAQSDVNDETTRPFDGTTWTENVAANPANLSVRRGPAIACIPEYAAALGADYASGFVLFAGLTPGVIGVNTDVVWNDAYVWRDSISGWLEITFGVGHVLPDPRAGHRFVYFPDIGKAVMFGGCDNPDGPSTVFADSWTFDGSSNPSDFRPWAQLGGVAPPARYGHTMAYDADRHVIVMAGGKNAAGQELSDIWELGIDLVWRQIQADAGTVIEPTLRRQHAALWDKDRRVAVLGPLASSDPIFELKLCGAGRLVTTDNSDMVADGLPNSDRTRAVYDSAKKRMLIITSKLGGGTPNVTSAVYSLESGAFVRRLLATATDRADVFDLGYDGAASWHKIFKADGVTIAHDGAGGATGATVQVTNSRLILRIIGGAHAGKISIDLNDAGVETLDDLAAFVNDDIKRGWSLTVTAAGTEFSSTLKRTIPTATPVNIKVEDPEASYAIVMGGHPSWSDLSFDNLCLIVRDGDDYAFEPHQGDWLEIVEMELCYHEADEATYNFGGFFIVDGDDHEANWSIRKWNPVTFEFDQVFDSVPGDRDFPEEWRPVDSPGFRAGFQRGFCYGRIYDKAGEHVDDVLIVRINYDGERMPADPDHPFPGGVPGGPKGDFYSRFFSFNTTTKVWKEITEMVRESDDEKFQHGAMAPQVTAGGACFDADA